MKGDRANKTEEGSHEYQEGAFTICLMGNGEWYIFNADKSEVPSPDFKTLTAARKWLRQKEKQNV
jgi:hypothetical protein